MPLNPAEASQLIAEIDDAPLPDDEACAVLDDWRVWARPSQLPPVGDWRIWLLLAGRGFGKTRSGAEWVRGLAESGAAQRIALVAPTARDARLVMVLNPLLDAVEAALAPDPVGHVQTLGGLVSHCWIAGRIQTDEGVPGGQAVAIVPVEILVSG